MSNSEKPGSPRLNPKNLLAGQVLSIGKALLSYGIQKMEEDDPNPNPFDKAFFTAMNFLGFGPSKMSLALEKIQSTLSKMDKEIKDIRLSLDAIQKELKRNELTSRLKSINTRLTNLNAMMIEGRGYSDDSKRLYDWIDHTNTVLLELIEDIRNQITGSGIEESPLLDQAQQVFALQLKPAAPAEFTEQCCQVLFHYLSFYKRLIMAIARAATIGKTINLIETKDGVVKPDYGQAANIVATYTQIGNEIFKYALKSLGDLIEKIIKLAFNVEVNNSNFSNHSAIARLP